MSTSDIDHSDDHTERLLSDFFKRERPQSWPEPPWRNHERPRRHRQSMRGKSVLVAALVLATFGLSILGEVPSSWPETRDSRTRGKMEASRVRAASKPHPLPGFSVPPDSTTKQSPRP